MLGYPPPPVFAQNLQKRDFMGGLMGLEATQNVQILENKGVEFTGECGRDDG
jgi:hypothetical protein